LHESKILNQINGLRIAPEYHFGAKLLIFHNIQKIPAIALMSTDSINICRVVFMNLLL
jgi:hypothetical protein